MLDFAIREPSDLGESRVCAGVRLGRKGGGRRSPKAGGWGQMGGEGGKAGVDGSLKGRWPLAWDTGSRGCLMGTFLAG